MARIALTGTRLRTRRLDLGLRQVDLARDVGISASYLNLIEHNRRRIGGKLLGALATALALDPASLSEGAESTLIQGLQEVTASHNSNRDTAVLPDPESPEDYAGRFPGWAAQTVAQHRRIAALETTVATLTDRMSHDPHLAAALHDILSSVTAIQSTSTILTGEERPDPAWQARFQRNIHEESARLADASQALAGYLEGADEGRPGTATPQEDLEAWLAARDWHTPGLETASQDDFETLIAGPGLRAQGARRVARIWLQRARDDAQALPLTVLRDATVDGWPDPGDLARRQACTVACVLRRLATLPADIAPGPAGLLVADGAGALTFRRPIDGFPLPRIGAGCPLWPLFEAIQQPSQPISATVELPGPLARRFRVYATAQALHPGTFTSPPVLEATMLILPMDEAAAGPIRLVGTACRVCPRGDCPARREPSILETAPDAIRF